MVGAGTIVMGPPSELGEHQDRNVVAGIVLAEVIQEGVQALGNVLPQLVGHASLVGVAVEAAVVDVEDAGAEVGHVHLSDTFQLFGDGGVGVLNVRGVHPRGFVQDVGAFQGVEAGLAHVVHDGAAADGRRVHSGEAVQNLGPLFFLSDPGEQAVVIEVIDNRNRGPGKGQGPEQRRTEADGGQYVLFAGVQVASGAAQPTLGSQRDGLTGVPDVHRAEMGARGFGVADAMDDAHVAPVVDLLQRSHLGVESNFVIDLDHAIFSDTHRVASIPVDRVGVGDNCV